MNVTYHVRTYEIVASIASFKASHVAAVVVGIGKVRIEFDGLRIVKVCECIRTSLLLSYQHDKDITQ